MSNLAHNTEYVGKDGCIVVRPFKESDRKYLIEFQRKEKFEDLPQKLKSMLRNPLKNYKMWSVLMSTTGIATLLGGVIGTTIKHGFNSLLASSSSSSTTGTFFDKIKHFFSNLDKTSSLCGGLLTFSAGFYFVGCYLPELLHKKHVSSALDQLMPENNFLNDTEKVCCFVAVNPNDSNVEKKDVPLAMGIIHSCSYSGPFSTKFFGWDRDIDYEFAKLYVSPEIRGRGVLQLIMRALTVFAYAKNEERVEAEKISNPKEAGTKVCKLVAATGKMYDYEPIIHTFQNKFGWNVKKIVGGIYPLLDVDAFAAFYLSKELD